MQWLSPKDSHVRAKSHFMAEKTFARARDCARAPQRTSGQTSKSLNTVLARKQWVLVTLHTGPSFGNEECHAGTVDELMWQAHHHSFAQSSFLSIKQAVTWEPQFSTFHLLQRGMTFKRSVSAALNRTS